MPITRWRAEPCGTNWPTFTPRPFFRSAARCAAMSMSPPPSGLTKIVVMPWRSSGSAAASAGETMPPPACVWVSMNPGAT